MNIEDLVRVIDFRHVTKKTAEDVYDCLDRLSDLLFNDSDPDEKKRAYEVGKIMTRFREETGI